MSTQFRNSETFLFQAIQFCQIVLIQIIQFSISTIFVHGQLYVKAVLFQKIQFSISMQIISMWPLDWTQFGAATLGQSGAESDGNEEVLRIPQSFNITETSLSDCLWSYQDTNWGALIPLQKCSQCILQC